MSTNHQNESATAKEAQMEQGMRASELRYRRLAGILVNGIRNRIEANNITRCGIGLHVESTENLVIRNSVSGSTGVAYSIVPGNSVGLIIVPSSSGTISGSSGGGLGSTDSNANFAY